MDKFGTDTVKTLDVACWDLQQLSSATAAALVTCIRGEVAILVRRILSADPGNGLHCRHATAQWFTRAWSGPLRTWGQSSCVPFHSYLQEQCGLAFRCVCNPRACAQVGQFSSLSAMLPMSEAKRPLFQHRQVRPAEDVERACNAGGVSDGQPPPVLKAATFLLILEMMSHHSIGTGWPRAHARVAERLCLGACRFAERESWFLHIL